VLPDSKVYSITSTFSTRSHLEHLLEQANHSNLGT
jgi:hypothetical protein